MRKADTSQGRRRETQIAKQSLGSPRKPKESKLYINNKTIRILKEGKDSEPNSSFMTPQKKSRTTDMHEYTNKSDNAGGLKQIQALIDQQQKIISPHNNKVSYQSKREIQWKKMANQRSYRLSKTTGNNSKEKM